jgi:glycosyltransferase involved in cell wall biosynthesis
MKVSAVIPTYNRRAYIKRAVDSILAQTVPVDEIVIIDDEKSTDGMAEAAAELYGSRVRVVREGGGLSGARRRGVQEAKGEWVAFLDSDDEWAPDRNRQFLETATRVSSDVAWIFGNLRIVSDQGDGITLFEEFGLTVKGSHEVFIDTWSIHFPFQFGLLQGSFIRRSVLIQLDCFSEGLQHSEDLLAGYQVASLYKFAAIPSVVGKYYRTTDLTSNSALLKGNGGPDYFRARTLCFALVMKTGVRRPWNTLYASATRGLCMALVKQGKSPGTLAFQQFRYGGVSAKGVAFYCAAVFGRVGILAWNAVAEWRRKLFPEQARIEKAGGFRAAVRGAHDAKK